ncbi:hypothetical protein RRG08_046798 [Elysia crispata]|uniref:Uncharacterized protein n=1 Tax=Elysia crispata TaxID=231223 RepID=A0AAE0Z6G1_9GAST|nr:hypothetical protein RRG08_046798 [Elysia crispata]
MAEREELQERAEIEGERMAEREELQERAENEGEREPRQQRKKMTKRRRRQILRDVEELMTKETILKEELRQIDLAAFAKKAEIAKVQEELLEYKKLKSSLPSLF